MSTRSAHRAATALGVAAALFAATAGLLLTVRQNALPPRWDVLGAAAAALLCLAARALAGRPAPAPPVGTPMPGLPAVLPPPRRAWQPVRQLVAGWLVLGCGYALLTLPSAQTYDRIGGLLRADARVTAGRIESAEHVAAVSWSYRKERPGSNRKVRNRPLQYRSDLVLTVRRPGGAVRIAVPGASTEDIPTPGRTVRVLAAVDHPELGGYLAADTDLNAYRSGVSPAGAVALHTLLHRRARHAPRGSRMP